VLVDVHAIETAMAAHEVEAEEEAGMLGVDEPVVTV